MAISKLSQQEMLDAGVHFGHLKEKMESQNVTIYFYGAQGYSHHRFE